MKRFNTIWNRGNMTWSTYSDARKKNNIVEDVKGLEFINRLRPVSYYHNIKAMTAIIDNKVVANYPGKYDVENKVHGFFYSGGRAGSYSLGLQF